MYHSVAAIQSEMHTGQKDLLIDLTSMKDSSLDEVSDLLLFECLQIFRV